MSGSNLAKKLIPAARQKYAALLQKQRSTVWGVTDITFRVRKYPKSKDERVSLIMPNWHMISLYSKVLGHKVELEMTLETLRHIEGMGGLDEYLLRTPDAKLRSDVASDLKWKLSCILQKRMANETKVAEKVARTEPKRGALTAEQPALGKIIRAKAEQRGKAEIHKAQAIRAEFQAARDAGNASLIQGTPQHIQQSS